MILTVIRIGLLRLRNNPLEMLLTFVVPVIFFSIFALIFGSGLGSGETSAVKAVIVDEDNSDSSAALVEKLKADSGLADVASAAALAPDQIDVKPEGVTREIALAAVRDGNAKIAIVVAEGFEEAMKFGGDPQVILFADSSDQIAPQLTEALVRRAIGQQAGDIQREKARRRIRLLPKKTRERFQNLASESEATSLENAVQTEDVLASGKANPRISMYAAGIAVLFVLFAATGAAATLLEEDEVGTLERLLSSQLSLTQLLTGKWLFIAMLALSQLVVMFGWAQLAFGVELTSHIPGFLAMAIPTAAAAASLSILLATVCQSRNQLNGVSLIVILTMSALGGSMVPRYIMSEQMQQVGLLTFNAWALEGFEKVFWRDLPVAALWPQILVLTLAGVMMFALAVVFARRWEA